MAGWMKNLGGNNSQVKIDPITGQPDLSATPTDYRITGFGRGGPRVEDFGALQDKAQMAFENRAYSPDAAKAISGAEAIVEKIGRLKEMTGMDKGEGMGYLPFGGFDTKGQMYKSLRNDIQSTLVYLKSGAAINESEFKRLQALLPGLFKKSEVDKDQLDRFMKEYGTIAERIKSGARWDNSGKKMLSPSGSVSSETKTYDAKSVFEGL
jgi:hypothetical protein